MSSSKWLLLSFFGGGIAFWISDLIIPAEDRNEQGYAVTVACPIVLILFYVAALRLRKRGRSGPATAIFAIFGTWILALSFALPAVEDSRGAILAIFSSQAFCPPDLLYS
jgi:hypothetical protein